MKGLGLLSVVTAALFLSGCLQTRSNLKEQEEKQVLQKTVRNLQQNTADVSVRFSDIEEDVRKLNGRIEGSDFRFNQMQQRLDKDSALQEQRYKEINEKLKAYQEALSKIDGQMAEVSAALSQLATQLKDDASSRVSTTPSSGGGSGGGKPKAANAFASAEELFNRKAWKDAILEYEKYRKNNPKGKQFAEATYKIGVAFQELGMNEEARAFYDEVVSKFPKSKEAGRATYRLRNLKKK